MNTHKKTDSRTYESSQPEKPTSYDTSQPDTNTPQEIRESRESSAQLAKQSESEPDSEDADQE